MLAMAVFVIVTVLVTNLLSCTMLGEVKPVSPKEGKLFRSIKTALRNPFLLRVFLIGLALFSGGAV